MTRNLDYTQHLYDALGVGEPAPRLQPLLKGTPMEPKPATATDTDTALVNIANAPFTWRTLTAIANTEFVPAAYRGQPEKMLGAILYGRESGLGPMTSMQMIDMVDGRPSMSAELMVAMVRRAGHSILLAELSPTGCTVQGIRRDSGDSMEYTFSAEHADRAGLAGRGAWKKYPESMLWARAVSQLVRMLFPDVLISMHNYTADELGADIPHQVATPTDIHDAAVEHATDTAIADAEIVDAEEALPFDGE